MPTAAGVLDFFLHGNNHKNEVEIMERSQSGYAEAQREVVWFTEGTKLVELYKKAVTVVLA